jgi:hypothetical protein
VLREMGRKDPQLAHSRLRGKLCTHELVRLLYGTESLLPRVAHIPGVIKKLLNLGLNSDYKTFCVLEEIYFSYNLAKLETL